MNYLNYDISISKDLTTTAVFEGKIACGVLTFDKEEINYAIEKIEEQPDKDIVHNVGKRLAESLFVPEIKNHFCDSMRKAGSDGLRIRLNIEAPEVSAYPWEALFIDDKFVSTSTDTTLSRVFPYEALKRKKFSKPINFLIICANPSKSGLPSVQVEREIELIESSLRESIARGEINPEIERIGEVDRIMRRLSDKQYNVVHFIGHGVFENGTGYLALENKDGELDKADHTKIGQIFQNQNSLGLMVLNACQGATLSTNKAFSGLATELIKKGVPSVVAMKFSITNQTAKLFSREFYRNLLKMPLDENMQVVRQRILVDEDSSPRDFITPVLFINSLDNVVFSLGSDLPREGPIKTRSLKSQIDALKDSYDKLIEADDTIDERSFWLQIMQFYKTYKGELDTTCRQEIEGMTLRVPNLLTELENARLSGLAQQATSIKISIMTNFQRFFKILETL